MARNKSISNPSGTLELAAKYSNGAPDTSEPTCSGAAGNRTGPSIVATTTRPASRRKHSRIARSIMVGKGPPLAGEAPAHGAKGQNRTGDTARTAAGPQNRALNLRT